MYLLISLPSKCSQKKNEKDNWMSPAQLKCVVGVVPCALVATVIAAPTTAQCLNTSNDTLRSTLSCTSSEGGFFFGIPDTFGGLAIAFIGIVMLGTLIVVVRGCNQRPAPVEINNNAPQLVAEMVAHEKVESAGDTQMETSVWDLQQAAPHCCISIDDMFPVGNTGKVTEWLRHDCELPPPQGTSSFIALGANSFVMSRPYSAAPSKHKLVGTHVSVPPSLLPPHHQSGRCCSPLRFDDEFPLPLYSQRRSSSGSSDPFA